MGLIAVGFNKPGLSSITPFSTAYLRTSSFDILPCLPVPTTSSISIPCSFARLRTAGVHKVAPFLDLLNSNLCSSDSVASEPSDASEASNGTCESSTVNLNRVSPTYNQRSYYSY